MVAISYNLKEKQLVEISIYHSYWLLVNQIAIGLFVILSTSMHQIEFPHTASQGGWFTLIAAHRRCRRFNVVGLPTKVAELHLFQKVTPKMSWTITICFKSYYILRSIKYVRSAYNI